MHLFLHFLVPLVLVIIFYRKTWRWSYALMMAGLLIDIDHLLASPIYDPLRCSIGFHPLHTEIPMVLYFLLLFHPKTRVIGLGLCVHIILDLMDCQITNGIWFVA